MSLRQVLREFRPLFRLLEEPFGTSPRYPRYARPTNFLEDPFFPSPQALRPAVDVAEEGNKYVVEAELPGVKKEDVEVRIGDGGHSITIEGKVGERRVERPSGQPSEAQAGTQQAGEGTSTTAVTTGPQTNQISAEREFIRNARFTRTVWLPQPVRTDNVSAQLKDGVLVVEAPKAEEVGTSVPVQ